MNILDVSNILGIVLLYMKNISFSELESICNILKEKGYDIEINDYIVYSILEQWKDFFILDDDKNICLANDIL